MDITLIEAATKTKYEHLFISDVHLGSKHSKAKTLNNFLNSVDFENLYIVGDFIDLWAIKKYNFTHWGKAHNEIIRTLLQKINNGSRIYWITGNHDNIDSSFVGDYKNLTICEKMTVAIGDKKYLVMHGHQFDSSLKNITWMYSLGSFFYEKFVSLSEVIMYFQNKMGFRQRSLSKYIKENVKQGLMFIQNFEKACVLYCKSHDVDGIITGHIHTPVIKNIYYPDKDYTIIYLNCGDWVENCSYIASGENQSLYLQEHFVG